MRLQERNQIVRQFGEALEWARERLVYHLVADHGQRAESDVIVECERCRAKVTSGLSEIHAYAETLESIPFKTKAAIRLGESALRMLDQLCDAVEDQS